MKFKLILVFLFVSIFTSDFAFAQETVSVKDSTKLYENIQTYSEGSKFTRFMYRLFFKPIAPVPDDKKGEKKIYKKLIQKPYSAFEGKIIRKINIVTLDPFGSSIGDTIETSLNLLSKTGNRVHIKSHGFTIRNLLLIRQNQPFDSLLVKESERLVRSRGYITDVSFYNKTTSHSSDSVDIFIRVLDAWSIIPGGSISSKRVTINLTDQNFLGMGHEFKNGFTLNHFTSNTAFNTGYFIPNIRNTFVSTSFQYAIDEYGNFSKIFTVDRPFFSPFAKWAAGINISQQFQRDYLRNSDSVSVVQQYKYNAQDYWAGNAMQIFKGNSEYRRTTNFITAARFLRIRYLEKPAGDAGIQNYFSDENFYLASMGISTRKYVQDKYIFKFGITEDVPIGKFYNLTAGFQEKNDIVRLYVGGNISMGNYYRWGYLGSNIEYGTFLRDSHTEQTTLKAGINYFTGLIEIGKWKFRQFVKPHITVGFNRFDSDSLTIKEGFGLDGFNSNSLVGTSRMVFTLQTQSYSPIDFIGFHFGPFFTCTLGMLGNAAQGFRHSKVYSQIGIGVLIKNDNLVMNTLQISLAYYPSIPGKGQNIFKINSYKTTDFGFSDFEIGKPAVVLYR